MQWSLKWSAQIESGYYVRLLEKGFLKEEDFEPYLGPLDFFLHAFRELSSCRAVGFEAGPIPFTAILEYSRLYDVGDLDDFIYVMRMMDDAFLRYGRKDAKTPKVKDASKQPSPPNSGRR